MSSSSSSVRVSTPRKVSRLTKGPALVIEFVSLGEKPPRGAARYRDPANPFQTWSGRGKRPTWLRDYLESGRLLQEFEVVDESEG